MNNVAILASKVRSNIKRLSPEYRLVLALVLASEYSLLYMEFSMEWTNTLRRLAQDEGIDLDYSDYPNPFYDFDSKVED